MPKKAPSQLSSSQLITPVNTIVVGDVGSGKTAVALSVGVGYLLGLETGVVSLMAPTEILASQHYDSLESYLSPINTTFDTILLTQSLKKINNLKVTPKQLLAYFASKQYYFVIGTQALLFQDIKADLVMVDEQHRFGVTQRAPLTISGTTPHYISFTATPIPRTFALTLYKHLDILELERITTRLPVATTFSPIKQPELLLKDIQTHINRGKKVYILVPAVDSEDEAENELYTLKKAEALVTKIISKDKIVITHGKQKTKTADLKLFKEDPNIQVCIATSVIEVGLDVSEATLIVILNAERFGLATLHQLRGRVGRNDENYNQCIIAATFLSPRLKLFLQTTDGFAIAEADLELRGGGELTGRMQSGLDDTTELLSQMSFENRQKLLLQIEQTDISDPAMTRLKNYLDTQYLKTWKE